MPQVEVNQRSILKMKRQRGIESFFGVKRPGAAVLPEAEWQPEVEKGEPKIQALPMGRWGWQRQVGKRYKLEGGECVWVGKGQLKCVVAKCNFQTESTKDFTVHIRVHSGEKPFECDYEGCGYRSAQAINLATHRRTHTGEKPFFCDIEGCEYRCSHSSVLIEHQRTHTGDKPYACEHEGCDFRSANSNNLAKHCLTHTGEKPYKCPEINCDYRAATLGNVNSHFAAWHTAEACQRQKKAEEAVSKALISASIGFDREARINYGCGLTVDKRWANIDFVLYLPDRVLLLEVDENQHNGYGVGCDAARMSHVHSALISEDQERAVIFIRFNPDACRVDGRLIKVPKAERHSLLCAELRRLCKERTQGAVWGGQLQIHYMYYDSKTRTDGKRWPCVTEDDEWPEGLSDCIVAS